MVRSPQPTAGAGARIARLVDRVWARLERERERRYVVAVGFAIAERGRGSAASALAGALAFRFFLTIVPLTFVMVVGLGYLKSAGGSPSAALQQFGIRGVLASTVDGSAAFSDPGRIVLLLLGVVSVLGAARTTVGTLRSIHALAWGVPVVRWRHSGPAAVMFLVFVVVGFACASLAWRVRAQAGVPLGLGASAVLAVGVSGGWLVASLLLPHAAGAGWRALVPGAVLVGGGVAMLQAVTVNWVGPKLDHESSLYGSLGVSFVVLGWLYVVGRLMVGAPLLNAALLDQDSVRAERGRAEIVSEPGRAALVKDTVETSGRGRSS